MGPFTPPPRGHPRNTTVTTRQTLRTTESQPYVLFSPPSYVSPPTPGVRGPAPSWPSRGSPPLLRHPRNYSDFLHLVLVPFVPLSASSVHKALPRQRPLLVQVLRGCLDSLSPPLLHSRHVPPRVSGPTTTQSGHLPLQYLFPSSTPPPLPLGPRCQSSLTPLHCPPTSTTVEITPSPATAVSRPGSLPDDIPPVHRRSSSPYTPPPVIGGSRSRHRSFGPKCIPSFPVSLTCHSRCRFKRLVCPVSPSNHFRLPSDLIQYHTVLFPLYSTFSNAPTRFPNRSRYLPGRVVTTSTKETTVPRKSSFEDV